MRFQLPINPPSRPNPRIALAALALLAGCAASPPAPADQVALPASSWEGNWVGNSNSYNGHESVNGIHINRDGTGYAILSSLFGPRFSTLWVTRQNFSWTPASPSALKMTILSQETLAGAGSWGWRTKRKGDMLLYSTAQGLQLNGFGRDKTRFVRQQGGQGGDLAAAIVQDTLARAQAMGWPVNGSPGPGMAQIVQSALGSYQAGLQIGSALKGGNPGSLMPMMPLMPLMSSSATTASRTRANAQARDIVGNVQLGALEMSAYTDGKAYDVLTLMPVGGTSGGEWCYQYGIPLGNARSLLATGYALAAEKSAYGAGNPRQMISWQSRPVRQGDTINMGIEWRAGQMVSTPLTHRYEFSKP